MRVVPHSARHVLPGGPSSHRALQNHHKLMACWSTSPALLSHHLSQTQTHSGSGLAPSLWRTERHLKPNTFEPKFLICTPSSSQPEWQHCGFPSQISGGLLTDLGHRDTSEDPLLRGPLMLSVREHEYTHAHTHTLSLCQEHVWSRAWHQRGSITKHSSSVAQE